MSNTTHRIRQQFFIESGELDEGEAAAGAELQLPSEAEARKNESCARVALQPAITEDELNQRLQLELSKNMWKRCNPGFNHMAVSRLSKTQEEFLYDEDNVRSLFIAVTFTQTHTYACSSSTNAYESLPHT